MSRSIDIRMPIDNIYFWPTVDVRDIDSMPGFAGSGVEANSAVPKSLLVLACIRHSAARQKAEGREPGIQ